MDFIPLPRRSFGSGKAVVLVGLVLAGQARLALSQMSLPSSSAAPGSSILLPVQFVPPSSVSGLQFDVEYGSSAMSLIAMLGDTARNSEKTLYSVDLAPNKKRFLMVGLNQSPIATGTPINLFVNLIPNVSTGIYALALSNVVGTDPAGQLVPITVTSGTITIQGTNVSRLLPAGVLSAGSLLPEPVAAGEVVTLIGSAIGPAAPLQPAGAPSTTVLGNTRVLLDGVAAPLLYAGPNQINIVIPYAVSGKATAQLQVAKDGQTIAAVPIGVAPAVPAIFTMDSSGAGPGAILNEDSTVNSPSNPAPRGSVTVVFATCAGQTDPAGADGQVAGNVLPKPVLPVSVQIGGLDAEILYAGAAPGIIAGVLQVNVRVPAGVRPGYSVPVVLTVGTASSAPGVTMAVR